jgi:cytokinesis protein
MEGMYFSISIVFFFNLLITCQRSREKNTNTEDTRRRNEASMKRKGNATLSPASGTDTPPSPSASSGAMDDLLAKLRAAGPEAKDTRDRRRRARLKDRHAVRVASGQTIPEPPSKTEAEEVTKSESVEAKPEVKEEADVADRAANLLQDIGGPDEAEEGSVASRDSIRVRRRREGAEEERERRRQRRAQARSEVLSSNGDEETEEVVPESPAKASTPVTIVSPPSPEAKRDAVVEKDGEKDSE